MKRTVPLKPGNAHLKFRVELSGTTVEVRLDWLTRFGYYTAKITGPDGVLVAGGGLHPHMNLLEDVPDIPGSLHIEGREPTIDNLGVESRLVYEA